MLPLPENAPPEIPRIQLRNEALGWNFQYSPIRIDLFHTPKTVHSPNGIAEALSELMKRATNLWDLLSSEVSARGTRLAQVVSVSASVPGAADAIHDRFLSARVAPSVAEAQVHFLHKVDIAGLPSNRWTRILCQETNPDRLLVYVDFNTAAERILDVDTKMIGQFLPVASKSMGEVLVETIGEIA
jgi:hypothetical protein